MISAAEVGAAFRAACRDEIEAPKPGNVHLFSPGHGMTAEHFLASAAAAAEPLAAPGATIGARVLGAVSASLDAAGLNTNLGIVLLCAPLAAAAERGGALQSAVAAVVNGLDRADAQQVFRAISLANPGGLGAVHHHDVRKAATVDLLTAMAAAATRDMIAFQYVSGFNDVFLVGLAALTEARGRGLKPPLTAVAVYLHFLAGFPDTHIRRKYGPAAAAGVQREATEMLSIFQARRGDCLADLLAYDARLKSRGFNPGTSADLTVATLFADRLRDVLLRRPNDA